MGPGLSAVPEVTEVELTEDDKYLVIGSDGVFDALSNKAIAKIVCKMTGTAQKVRWRVTPGGAPTPPPLPPSPTHMPPQTMGTHCTDWLPHQVCNELVKEMKKKPSGDDTTLIVVQLGPAPGATKRPPSL
jgi:serine/threonine protein phosphatase PrpC